MSREIPAGKVSLRSAWTLCCIASALFFLAAWGLGVHCLVLSPTVLGVLFLYSWAKRFTSYSHVILGLSLAMAPGGVWYALTAELAWLPVWMMLGVLFWVAGFDVLYSCQDIEFDRDNALRSIPAKLGISGALSVARGFHLASILCLGLFGYFAGLGVFFVVGLLLFTALLMSQHRLVSAHDLSRINAAFFTRNGAASILFLVTILIDRLF
jgi:4-hydroxybenzoate polyprenyltransferase